MCFTFKLERESGKHSIEICAHAKSQMRTTSMRTANQKIKTNGLIIVELNDESFVCSVEELNVFSNDGVEQPVDHLLVNEFSTFSSEIIREIEGAKDLQSNSYQQLKRTFNFAQECLRSESDSEFMKCALLSGPSGNCRCCVQLISCRMWEIDTCTSVLHRNKLQVDRLWRQSC
jgi:hypothetical protein